MANTLFLKKVSDSSFRLSLLLLFIQATCVWGLSQRYSATYDEPAHLVAGLSIWHCGNYGIYSVNPPVAKAIATLPLLLTPDVSLAALALEQDRFSRDEFAAGYLFSETNKREFHRLLGWARLPGLIWLFLGGLLLWKFSQSMHDEVAALLSVCFWVTSPLISSHAALATPDVPGMVAAIGCCLITYRYAKAGTIAAAAPTLLISAAVTVAALVKFTNLLLIPYVLLFFIATQWARSRSLAKTAKRLSQFLGISACVFSAITWMCYGFSGFGSTLASLDLKSQLMSDFPDSAMGWIPIPIPPDMVLGIDLQQCDFEGGMTSYMSGQSRRSGWWYFYLFAMLVKTPVGSLAAFTAGTLANISLGKSRWLESATLLGPAILFLCTISAKTGFTNNLRYALPCYPFFIMSAGYLGSKLLHSKYNSARSIVLILVLANTLSLIHTYPNWLGYFNEFAGGPSRGWRHLADSNVDWGQDLIFLQEWIDSNNCSGKIALLTTQNIDKEVYLAGRTCRESDALLIAVDYGWLLGTDPDLLRHEMVAAIGTSIVIFSVEKPYLPEQLDIKKLRANSGGAPFVRALAIDLRSRLQGEFR